jgi:hypothetical protein
VIVAHLPLCSLVIQRVMLIGANPGKYLLVDCPSPFLSLSIAKHDGSDPLLFRLTFTLPLELLSR